MTTNLNHFITAQKPVYPEVLQELAQGNKTSHWMWFIFPQLLGLGRSETAKRFALRDIQQARDYLSHPVLGARLLECAALLLRHPHKSALEIFGSPDDLKLHSSLTLFAMASQKDSIFEQLLQQFFKGVPDHNTIKILNHQLA